MTANFDKGPFLGMRHMQVVLIFLNIVAIYMSRLNIGVAVVAMTNAATTNPDFPEYDWSEKKISYIHSSFFWGYFITQLPGGMLSKRFGAKIIMILATFLTGLLSAATPWCVSGGNWQAYCTIRFCQGLSQGFIFPSIYEHLAKWLPLEERVRLGALSQTGVECGTVVALGVSGLIADGPLGWPGIFYISTAICFISCCLWMIFGANNATVSRLISEKEKNYIESSLQHAPDFHQHKIPVPWSSIFRSVPFVALIIVRCCEGYGLNILQTQIPSYMNGVLGFRIKSSALFSALPFVAMWALSYVYVIVADLLLRKNLSLTTVRKLINTTAFWLPAAGLIGIGFLGADTKGWAIAVMTLSVGFNSGNSIGSTLNTIDLTPNHAGVLMGVVNSLANLMPIIAPLVVGVIVTDTSNRSQWQLVFISAAVLLFFGNLTYIIWGSAKTQPWNAEDFLTPAKDAESACVRKHSTAKAVVANSQLNNDAIKF